MCSSYPRRQAEPLHRRSLAGREAQLGTNHPDTLASMHNLAALLWQQGKLEEAELRVFGVRGDLTGRFHQGHIFVWPRPEAWIFSCQFPNIAGLPFLGVIHRWDPHPHFVIGKMNTWQNCQIFPVNSCK